MMKVAVITGASSGLGAEFLKHAVKMYPELERIYLIARREDRLSELAEKYGEKCVPVAMDLSLDSSYERLEQILCDADADVRLLINNAGFGRIGKVIDGDPKIQTAMVDLNCRGLTGVACVCMRHMHSGAQIINTCSIASFVPNPGLTVYSSTKAYVLSFTKGLREELKPLGINCMCVCPGPMKTEFLTVAKIEPGVSKAFDTLPYCDVSDVAKKALLASKKGRCVYTNRAVYKLYRLLAKLLPHSFLMKLSKV